MHFKPTYLDALSPRLVDYGGFFSGIFLVTIYFSTSLAIISSVVLGLLWLFSGQFKNLPYVLKHYRVAAWSLSLFACFIISSTYSSAIQGDVLSMLSKYRELVFIPVLITFLSKESHRTWVWKMFVLASVVTLVCSYLMDIGLFGAHKQHVPSFKSYITHSIFMAFFAFFCLHKIYEDKRYRWFYIVLFGLCLGNIFFVVVGRTGQLIAIALVLLFALQRFSNKGRLLAVIAVIVSLTLFLSFSDKANRIHGAVSNTQDYLKPVPEKPRTSMSLRYTFWEYSLKLIAEKPLLGHGAGSFNKEYHRLVHNKFFSTKNPHNEFLMIAVQLGMLGLFIYVGFLASQYYYARALPNPDKWLAQGVLLALIITAFFNTPFFDHTEGHWFALMIALCFASLQNSPINHVR